MPFNNPIVAGEELIRQSIRSENFVSAEDSEEGGGSGWSINRDGSAEFNNILIRGNTEGLSASFDTVTANESLLYRGEELSDLLARNSKGLIAFGALAGSSFTGSGGSQTLLIELDVETELDRVYRIYTNTIRVSSPTNEENVRFLIFYTIDGSQPVPFSGTTQLAEIAGMTVSVANRTSTLSIAWTAYPQTTRLRVLLTMDTEFNNTRNIPFVSPDRPKLHVEDIGFLKLTDTGINRYAGGGGALVYKTLEVTASAFRTYTGTGAYDRNDFMFQGNVAGPGNRRSMCWFPFGSLGDLVGVTAGNIVYVDVYAHFPHWWSSAGGTAVLGWTTANEPAIGAPQPGGSASNIVQQGYPARNVGQWFSIKGTIIDEGLRNGTFRGLMLGPGPTTSNVFYGYASEIRIRAGYYK